MTKKIQSIPEARLLLESLRSVGYNEETAIADIIDNCISAKAHEIKIQLVIYKRGCYSLRFSFKMKVIG